MRILEYVNYVLVYLQLKLFPPQGFSREDAKALAKVVAFKAHKEVV